MEFIRKCELEFPELDCDALKDVNEDYAEPLTPELPYFKEIYKCYLGYRQC